MTAHHYSPVVVDRSMSFTQAMTMLLRDAGYGVHIAQPSVMWDEFYLREYDHVMVGVAPPMALSANSIYGALSVISKMQNSDKMTFFIDSPEHWQIFANVKAIMKNPDSLFKPFYSRRAWYFSAMQNPEVRKEVMGGIEFLFEKPWHRTFYPLLPWSDEQTLTAGTPENARINLVGIHVDSVYHAEDNPFHADKIDRWLVENEKSRWTKTLVDSLTKPSTTVKTEKLRTDEQIIAEMSRSLGVIVGPGGDKKFWWSPRYAQALAACTPVVTEWKDSSSIGDAWNHLAAGVEEMSQIDRFEVAVTQKKQYFGSIQNKKDTASYLRTLLGIK
ncbi:hypothetical protein [Actinomycetia phage DSL-LC01]|nr:hypothetical protein [Actinomycetia phage DSL-LC01]